MHAKTRTRIWIGFYVENVVGWLLAGKGERQLAGALVDVYLPGRLGEPRQVGVDAPLAGHVHLLEEVRHGGGLVHPRQGHSGVGADTIPGGGADQLAGVVLFGFGADGVIGAGELLPLMVEHEGLLGEASPHADPGGVEQQAWLCGS
jgi:hypothetical protein